MQHIQDDKNDNQVSSWKYCLMHQIVNPAGPASCHWTVVQGGWAPLSTLVALQGHGIVLEPLYIWGIRFNTKSNYLGGDLFKEGVTEMEMTLRWSVP